MVKVIASDVRKGNVLEHEDGKLYVVMSHETFRPGKGTPTTTIVMRRITDGVKTTAVFKTTDGLEKAFVEQIKHSYLYDDGDAGLVFMNPTTYEQVHLSRDMVGDSVAYLQPEMIVDLTMYEGQALSIELPPRVTATIETTEPVVKGQTASSSYKPAMLDIGVRTMVPPHIEAGTRVVISTEDGSYVERARIDPGPVTFNVHRLASGDIARFRALNALFARVFEDARSYAAKPPSDIYAEKVLSKESIVPLVALDGDRVIGGLVAYELDKLEQERSEFYIYDLAVEEEFRRRGVATALVRRLGEIAARRGAWVIYVQADYGDEPAIALYTKLGRREDVMHFDIDPG